MRERPVEVAVREWRLQLSRDSVYSESGGPPKGNCGEGNAAGNSVDAGCLKEASFRRNCWEGNRPQSLEVASLLKLVTGDVLFPAFAVLCSHRSSEQRCGHHSAGESQCRAKPILPRLAERYELAGMRLLATKDWTSLEERCLTLIDLRIFRHATSSASDRTLRPTRPATHKMSPLSARTSPAAETAESTHHASRHLHDAPSFTSAVRLMRTQTATEWGRCLQWLWGTVMVRTAAYPIAVDSLGGVGRWCQRRL